MKYEDREKGHYRTNLKTLKKGKWNLGKDGRVGPFQVSERERERKEFQRYLRNGWHISSPWNTSAPTLFQVFLSPLQVVPRDKRERNSGSLKDVPYLSRVSPGYSISCLAAAFCFCLKKKMHICMRIGGGLPNSHSQSLIAAGKLLHFTVAPKKRGDRKSLGTCQRNVA